MRAVIIFAAGQGTRMRSTLPKVLHTIAHKSMLSYVYDTAKDLDPAQIILVASESLKQAIEKKDKTIDFDTSELTLAVQDNPLGTGHALQVAFHYLHPQITEILVLYGDVPFVNVETLQPLLEDNHECCFLGMHVTPPHAYGRMMTEGENILKIVEDKDATAAEKTINYVWSGVLTAKTAFLKDYLPKLAPSPVTGEYYITDIIKFAALDGKKVRHKETPCALEFEGVNDKVALARMEQRQQEAMRADFLEKGVKMIAPETVFFAHDTVIEADVTLMPFITFGKNVCIKSGALIFSHCHIEASVIEEGVRIGPFAHLREGNSIGKGAVIGNFVEVKHSTLHSNVKAKHLSYLGDTEIGEGTNIGAGTVACNYDGKNKHKTTIKAHVSIGGNTTLVAPVTIEDNVIVAAGSVITEDVPKNVIAFGRARQVNKERKK